MNSPEIDRVARIYNDVAATWDQRQGVVERGLMGEEMRRELVRNLRGRVLEIGTGTGPTLRLLAGNSSVTAFTGLDLSPGMLAEAKRHTAALPFPVDLQVGNAEALPFADASFDTVTTSLTLCTVPDPALALREMARVCTPDGRMVLLEHVRARNPLLLGMQRLLAPLQRRMLGCHLDRPTDRLVREIGFEVEHERSRFFGIFRLMVVRPRGMGQIAGREGPGSSHANR